MFADPGSAEAKDVLAHALQRLGYGSECATWRNCFLTGADELRNGITPTPFNAAAGMARALSVTQLFDTIAIRVDGPRAASTSLSVLWDFTDMGERYLMRLSNGALTHHPTRHTPETDLTITLTHAQLLGILASGSLDGVQVSGDPVVVKTLMSLTDAPAPSFPVVTP